MGSFDWIWRSRAPFQHAGGWPRLSIPVLGLLCTLLAFTSGELGAGDGADASTLRGTLTCLRARDCDGALVYIEKLPGRSFPPGPDAIIDQFGLTFVPHVLPIAVGTRVTFPNSDEVRHNVFSFSPAKLFNLGTYPVGTARHMVFDKPGVVEVLCNVHASMYAYIVVLETPYVARVAPDGKYVLDGVPSGAYVLAAWHEALKAQRRPVVVGESQSLTVDFELRP